MGCESNNNCWNMCQGPALLRVVCNQVSNSIDSFVDRLFQRRFNDKLELRLQDPRESEPHVEKENLPKTDPPTDVEERATRRVKLVPEVPQLNS